MRATPARSGRTHARLSGSPAESPAVAASYEIDPLCFAALPAHDLATLSIGLTEDFDSCDVDDTRALFRSRMAALGTMVRSCEPVSHETGAAM
ncbi:amidase [Caballeronia arvi]|uniref:Amidase n=1 Tax=Caballeronia arvi TaxID=1777135 RepID=A0A158KZC3_9BURK|nr:hypothetical protein [Caballeronia arvi]SAL85751.1 amidase [Caballeronia arvi]